jgi:1-deoxy-D-xylulose-5-phosphate synthase
MGGFGSAVLEFAADHGYRTGIRRLGIPDAVVEHGEQMELYRDCGYDVKGIKAAVLRVLENVKA